MAREGHGYENFYSKIEKDLAPFFKVSAGNSGALEQEATWHGRLWEAT